MGTLKCICLGAVAVKKTWTIIVLAAGLLAGCSNQPDGAGSYVASDADSAMMVQITSIEDGRVSGTMSVVIADENGKTSAVTRPLSGTLEGNALNLSVENGTGLSLVTGMMEGEKLRLTFFGSGDSSQIIFAKSNAAEFDKLVGATRHRSAEKKQEIETATAQKERMEQRSKTQKTIEDLADKLFAKAQELQEKSKKIDIVIASYRSARDRLGKMQTAKRGIDTNADDGSYRIAEIDYDISGLSSDMESTHRDVQSYAQSLDGFMTETASQSPWLIAECEADNLLDCSRLSASANLLKTRNQEFQIAYSRETAAFVGKRGNKS